jgi:hypothetical protein
MTKQEQESLFDDNELHPDVTQSVSKVDDSESLFDDSEMHPEANVSKIESMVRGAASGTTAGLQDEGSGILDAMVGREATESTKDILSKYGPAGWVPAAANLGYGGAKKTASTISDLVSGDKSLGDLLQSYKKDYESGRDESRNLNAAAQEANPDTFLTADVIGSMASPINKLAIGAQLPKAANLVGRTINTAKNIGKIAPVAAVETYGRSDATNLDELGNDLQTGALITAAVPAGLQMGGELGRVAKGAVEFATPQAIQDFTRRAYDLGKQGVVTTSKEFLDESKRKLSGLSDTITSPLYKKAKEIAQMREAKLAEEVNNLDNLIKTNNSKIDNIVNVTKGQLDDQARAEIRRLENEMTQAKINLKKKHDSMISSQEKVKNVEYNESQKALEEVTANTQNSVYKAKTNIKKEYDNIDKELGDKDFVINTNELIENVRNNLELSGVQPEVADKMLKKITTYDGDLNFQQFQQLKQELENLGDSAAKKNPAVSAVFREAFGNSKKLQLDAIKEIPDLAPIAERLSNNNLKYTGFMNASKYLDDVRLHSFAKNDSGTKVLAAAPLTAKRIKKLVSVEAADSIENKDLIDSMRTAGVDEADIKKMFDVSDMVQGVESRQIAKANMAEEQFLDPAISQIKSNLDTVRTTPRDAQAAATMNPEVQRLRELIEGYKAQKAGIKDTPLTAMEQQFKPYDASSPEAIRNKVSDLMERNVQAENKASDFVTEERIFNDLENVVGPEQAQALAAQKATNLGDLDLGRLAQSQFREMSLTKPGLARTLIGGIAKPMASVANKVGLIQNKPNIKSILEKYNKMRGSDQFSRMTRSSSAVQSINDERNYTPINNVSNEDLNAMSQNLMNSTDVTDQHISQKLDKASKGDRYQKAATNFDLMQTEAGRKLLNKNK